MPISAEDIALSNSFSALEKNRNLEWKVNAIIRTMMVARAIAPCQKCEGKGWIAPASAVACKSCDGAGFIPTGK